jgi:CysZ protein
VIGDLARGVGDGLRGAAYLARHPRLWTWVAAPALIAAIVLIAAIGTILGWLGAPIAALAAVVPGDWADNVLRFAATIILAIASISIVVSFAALIAAPFNEQLSERVEEAVTGVPAPPFRFGRFLVELGLGVAHAARRVSLYAITMLLLLIVGVAVPVVGTVIAAAGGAWATARFAAYDAHDAVFARRRWRYRRKMAYLRERRWRGLGLGAVVAALLVVPFVNIIGLSIGATAATLRVVDEERAGAVSASSRPPSPRAG